MTFPHPALRAPLSREERGTSPDFHKYCIAVVVPCYRVEREIQSVLRMVPSYIKHIIVVEILAIQLLLSAIEIDLRSVPTEPTSNSLK